LTEERRRPGRRLLARLGPHILRTETGRLAAMQALWGDAE
jgi:16S rRNA U1498 N3-methylase RsmE